MVVFCRQHNFLGIRIGLDERRLRALAPDLDPAAVEPPLAAIAPVVAGEPSAGPLAQLSPSERFGWVAAKSSTAIQPSEVHTGLTDDPQATLDHLFTSLGKCETVRWPARELHLTEHETLRITRDTPEELEVEATWVRRKPPPTPASVPGRGVRCNPVG